MAGVKPQDIIVSVDEQIVRNMTLESVAGLIRGFEGTKVNLKLRRGPQEINLELERTRIVDSPEARSTTEN